MDDFAAYSPDRNPSGSDSLLSIALSDLHLPSAPPGLWNDLTIRNAPTLWNLPAPIAISDWHSGMPEADSIAVAELDVVPDNIVPAAVAHVWLPGKHVGGLAAGAGQKKSTRAGMGSSKPGKAHRFCGSCGVVNHVRRLACTQCGGDMWVEEDTEAAERREKGRLRRLKAVGLKLPRGPSLNAIRAERKKKMREDAERRAERKEGEPKRSDFDQALAIALEAAAAML